MCNGLFVVNQRVSVTLFNPIGAFASRPREAAVAAATRCQATMVAMGASRSSQTGMGSAISAALQ
jgi:hypothetical protein